MHKAVVEALRGTSEDPLAEGDALEQHVEFLTSHRATERQRSLSLLDRKRQRYVALPLFWHLRLIRRKKKSQNNTSSLKAKRPMKQTALRRSAEKHRGTGYQPRQARSRIRATPAQGFYGCVSQKHKIRTSHKLGACYLLPGSDDLDQTNAAQNSVRLSHDRNVIVIGRRLKAFL